MENLLVVVVFLSCLEIFFAERDVIEFDGDIGLASETIVACNWGSNVLWLAIA